VKPWTTAASLLFAAAAAVFLLVVPVYTGSFPNGRFSATLVQVNGTWSIIPVLFPAALALAALVFRKRAVRVIAAILIGGFAIVSGFSIGLFYFPSAAAMLLAACLEPSA
jgi:hypothetical protein